MSKDKPVKKVIRTQPTPPRSKTYGSAASRKAKPGSSFSLKGGAMIFGKSNLIYMIAGVVLIGIGMILMSGGGMKDPNEWKPEVIYSTRITVFAPIFILAGLAMQIWAIFKRDNPDPIESA